MFGSLPKKPHSYPRKQVSNIYTKNNILKTPVAREVFQEVVHNRWMSMLSSATQASQPLDDYELDLAIIMDLTSAYVYGIPNGTNHIQDVEERTHWNKHYMFSQQEMYSNIDLLTRWKLNPLPKKFDTAIEVVEEGGMTMADAITKRDIEGKAPANEGVLYHQLQKTIPSDPETKAKQLASEMLHHCFAGHGTASITLTYIFYHLSLHPEYQSRHYAELAALGPNPDIQELSKLPLLEGIIPETLRLYPSPPAAQPRITLAGGCTLGSYSNIPGGVRVGSQGYSLHRNEAVYPDAERCWPERWISFYRVEEVLKEADERARAEDEQRRREMQHWFFSFGSGNRACPGKDYGMLDIKAVMSATYAKFTTEVAGDDDMTQMDGNSEGQPKGMRCLIRFNTVKE